MNLQGDPKFLQYFLHENLDQMFDVVEVEPGEEIEAVPEVVEESNEDSLTIHDELVVTARSSVKLLRDACRWLGV